MDGSAHTIDTWERLVRYHRVTLREMDVSLQSAFGHSLEDYDVLHQVHRHGEPITMGDLSDRLLVANSSCTRIVGRLVEDGHLIRRRGTTDGRQVLVDMTVAGRRLYRRMAARHTRDIRRLFGDRLAPPNQVGLAAALDELLRADGR